MFEFFARDYDEVSTDEGIRTLYPIAASLSAGQTAGIEFLSITEMFSIALADENTYKNVENELEKMDTASVYEGINREIYEKGGVALTSDTLRAKALESDTGEKENYKIGTLPIVFWGITAGFAAATITSSIVTATVKQAKQVLETVSTKAIVKQLMWQQEQTLHQVLQPNLMSVARGGPGLRMIVKGKNLLMELDKRIADLRNNPTTTVTKTVKVTNQMAKYLSIGFAVITVIMTVVSTVMTMLDASKFYDTEYTPIPKYIVEESDITATNAKGEQFMLKNQTAYYKVVRCNRTAGDSSITKKNFEVMGDANDLNGDIGTQWLSLYAVKYENGAPILADSLLYQINGERVPDGYSTGIHEFGAKPACDINSAKYLFPEKTPEIKVHFKHDTSVQSAGAAGSLFTAGSLAIGGGVGLVVGALFGGLVMSRRKKKPTEA